LCGRTNIDARGRRPTFVYTATGQILTRPLNSENWASIHSSTVFKTGLHKARLVSHQSLTRFSVCGRPHSYTLFVTSIYTFGKPTALYGH